MTFLLLILIIVFSEIKNLDCKFAGTQNFINTFSHLLALKLHFYKTMISLGTN